MYKSIGQIFGGLIRAGQRNDRHGLQWLQEAFPVDEKSLQSLPVVPHLAVLMSPDCLLDGISYELKFLFLIWPEIASSLGRGLICIHLHAKLRWYAVQNCETHSSAWSLTWQLSPLSSLVWTLWAAKSSLESPMFQAQSKDRSSYLSRKELSHRSKSSASCAHNLQSVLVASISIR